MMIERYIRQYIGILKSLMLALLAPVALSSCVADEDLVLGDGNPDDNVMVRANVLPSEKTRAYIPEGEINDGEWYMIFRSSYNSYNKNAIVNFGHPEGPTTGFAYFMNDDVEKELKWRDVYNQGSSSQDFYLTNLNPDRYTTQSNLYITHFRFNTGTNPFVASPLNKESGINDILIGKTSGRRSDKNLNFSLNHALSLLKVNVEVYGSSDNFFVDLSDAEVTITDLCRTVESVQVDYPTTFRYNESTTTTDAERGGTYSNPGIVTLVANSSEDPLGPSWENNGPKDVPIDGGKVKKVYSTLEFIMPPQSIPPSPLPSTATTDYTGKHPMLKIKVKKSTTTGQEDMEGYVTYSGTIPDIMFTLDENGQMIPIPERIALKSGAQLNITATINSPETDLMFAPVTIEPWVGRESFSLNTRQAGIYNENQFWEMVKAYEANDMHALERYGYWDGDATQNAGRGNFVFQLWATIPLNEDAIKQCLVPREPSDNPNDVPSSFCFIFNGFSVAYADNMDEVTDDTPRLEGSAGAIEFYNIVTGENEQYRGITCTQDLENVTALFANSLPPVKRILQYGDINNATNNLVFQIEGSFDIDIQNVFLKTATKQWNYTVSFPFAKNETVNVVFTNPNDPSDVVKLACQGQNSDFDYFTRLIFNNNIDRSGGANNALDFYFCVDCYNIYAKYYEDILRLYGAKNGATWELRTNTAMTLDGQKVLYNMVPDAALGRPSYKWYWISGVITIDDPYTPFQLPHNNATYDASYFTYITQGTGSTIKPSDIVKAYEKNDYFNLWQSGYFKNGEWRFAFTNNAQTFETVSWPNVFGKMMVNNAEGKYPYKYAFNGRTLTINDMPSEEGSSSTTTRRFQQSQSGTTYPHSMEAYVAICDGTFWDYLREWQAAQGKRRK